MAKAKDIIFKVKKGFIFLLILMAFILLLAVIARAVPRDKMPQAILPVADFLNDFLTLIAAAVLIFVGVVLLAASPVLGGIFLLIGGILAVAGILDMTKKKPG